MASSRKRSRQPLPSIESLLEDAQQSDESFANLKSGFDAISRTPAMDFGKENLRLHPIHTVLFFYRVVHAFNIVYIVETLRTSSRRQY